MNELLLMIATAVMIGAAIWNTHQALVLRGINKRLLAVVAEIEADMKASQSDGD